MSESPSNSEQPEASAEPTAEELVAELQKVRVGDLLFHTTSMLASLAYGKLAPETRDLADAQLAIDALRALVPLLAEEHRTSVQQVVSNLQLAYADAASSG
ncbi:MAG TPA: hypothetical protein VFA56_01830 [Gaiellaceae bacterium]|nr:hypothetical protein [Gaiellaceae bacterium]